MPTLFEQYQDTQRAQDLAARQAVYQANGDAMDAMFTARTAMHEAVNAYFVAMVNYHISRGASPESARDNAERSIEELYEYGTWTNAIQVAYDAAAD
jgi:hypothetical protein